MLDILQASLSNTIRSETSLGYGCLTIKCVKTIRTHTKFVQDVQFGPSGDHFASVGSDSKIFLYDGKTGETVAEFTDSPHKGTIVSYDGSVVRIDRLTLSLLDVLLLEPR